MDALVDFILGSNYIFTAETIVRIFGCALVVEFIPLVSRSFNRF